MIILDGLIALHQADAKLVQPCRFDTVNALLTSGLGKIEAERRKRSASAPVQRYLLQAKLAGHRTRQLAEDCQQGGRPPSEEELEAKAGDYCALAGVATDARVMTYWGGLLALDADSCSR